MGSSSEQALKPSKEVVPLTTWVLISKLKLEYMLMRGPDGSFNRNLAEFHDRKTNSTPSPRDGVATMDVTMDRSTGLWSRLFLPVSAYEPPAPGQSEEVPIILYFHGGSYAHSSANSAMYDVVCRRLAKACRAVIISVNYRRTPEHRFPAAYEDGFTALKWLRNQAHRSWLPSGANLGRCFLIGDSSGGNMVHFVGLRAAASREEISPVKVVGHVLMIPMFGGEARTESEERLDGQYFVTIQDRDYYWKLFLPAGEDRDHPACNVFGPRSEESCRVLRQVDLPRSLVVVAGLDMLQDWQMKYVEGMRASGKECELLFLEETPVGFFIFPNTEQYYRVMERIEKFVREEGVAPE